MPKPLTLWITTNWKILKEMGIPDHLTCLLRNLYAGQEAAIRTGHGTTDWFQVRKFSQRKEIYLFPCSLEELILLILPHYLMQFPEGGNGNPSSMDRGAWRAKVPWGCKELNMTD